MCFPTLQLDNMLLHGRGPRPMLRICDFGYSKDELGQSVSKSTCGTPEYMAPEVRLHNDDGEWSIKPLKVAHPSPPAAPEVPSFRAFTFNI